MQCVDYLLGGGITNQIKIYNMSLICFLVIVKVILCVYYKLSGRGTVKNNIKSQASFVWYGLFIQSYVVNCQWEGVTYVTILCLTSRTNVTSVHIPEEDACYRARNFCVFSRLQKGTLGFLI